MRKYLLDTNIISYYLKGFDSLKEKLTDNIDLLAISIISYYEIVSGLQSINATLMQIEELPNLKNFANS